MTASFHATAKKFASEQTCREKVKQVYLNTLAILTVKAYLDWMEFETDEDAGSSWNYLIRHKDDTADLFVENIGFLECRRVLPGETVIELPPEVQDDRIAYVLVQFTEELREVELLGFVPKSEDLKAIKIKSLLSLVELVEYLENYPGF